MFVTAVVLFVFLWIVAFTHLNSFVKDGVSFVEMVESGMDENGESNELNHEDDQFFLYLSAGSLVKDCLQKSILSAIEMEAMYMRDIHTPPPEIKA